MNISIIITGLLAVALLNTPLPESETDISEACKTLKTSETYYKWKEECDE